MGREMTTARTVGRGSRVVRRLQRVTRDPARRYRLALRRPWRDGTCAILFSPAELIEKLAALVPRPRINLLIYHGAFAPNARTRRDAVASACAATSSDAPRSAAGRNGDCGQSPAPVVGPPGCKVQSTATAPMSSPIPAEEAPPDLPGPSPAPDAMASPLPPQGTARRTGRNRHPSWAELLRRAWAVDVLACRACGGRLSLVATIQDAAVVRRILAHLGLPTEIPQPLLARAPPDQPGDLAFPDY